MNLSDLPSRTETGFARAGNRWPLFGIMREPKRNVPPRWAALFLFYCRSLPCQHGHGKPGRLNYAAS